MSADSVSLSAEEKKIKLILIYQKKKKTFFVSLKQMVMIEVITNYNSELINWTIYK